MSDVCLSYEISIKYLHSVLHKNNKRYTPERESIYLSIIEEDNEFTANDIIYSLPNTNAVTIYNTLSLFEDIGLIKRVPSIENITVYKLVD